MTRTEFPTPSSSASGAAPAAPVFFAVGLLSLIACLGALLVDPELILGDPRRAAAMGLTHLMALGFVTSLIFGASYVVLPVLAGAPLWSRKLAWAHAGLHLVAVAGMVVAFATGDMVWVGGAGGLFLLGIAIYVWNLLMTASTFNRWDPANITFVSGLFWLSVSSGLAVYGLLARHLELPGEEASLWMTLHAHLGLVGFFWMILLGAGLKLFGLFLDSSRDAGGLSWLGLLALNTGLFLLVPLERFPGVDLHGVLTGILVAGSALYLLDLARIAAGARRSFDGGLLTAALGILSGLGLMVWVLLGMPVPAGEEEVARPAEELVRMYFVLAFFGTFTLAIMGMGTRMLPFMAMSARGADVGSAAEAANPGGRGAVAVCMLLGFGYLAAAQAMDSAGGTQIAALCFAVGLGWFLYTVFPVLRAGKGSAS